MLTNLSRRALALTLAAAATAAGVILLAATTGGDSADAGGATPTPMVPPAPLVTQLWGDVDCNGAVTIGDAQQIAKLFLGLFVNQQSPCPTIYRSTSVNGTVRQWGDADCRNGITIGDAVKTARALVGLSINAALGCPLITEQVQVPNEEITWEQAVELIQGCFATAVGQTHARLVVLSLRDGTERRTSEPHLDDVLHIAFAAEDTCGDILIYTE